MTGVVRARDVTAAFRALYPAVAGITTRLNDDGTCTVTMPGGVARYLGIGHDQARFTGWLGYALTRQVEITHVQAAEPATLVTFAMVPGGAIPYHHGTSRGVPAYETVEQVLGGFEANRVTRALVGAALDAGLRPHLDLVPSPRGRGQYRVLLWGTSDEPLCGCFDVSEVTGRFSQAWLMWGRGPGEIRYDQPGLVREEIRKAGHHRDVEQRHRAAR